MLFVYPILSIGTVLIGFSPALAQDLPFEDCSGNPGAAPSPFDGDDCNDICVRHDGGDEGHCALSHNASDTADTSANAVTGYGSDPDRLSVWGSDSDGDSFCCVLDDMDLLATLIIEGSDTRDDVIRLFYSASSDELSCDDDTLFVEVLGNGGDDFIAGSSTDTETRLSGCSSYDGFVCYREELNGGQGNDGINGRAGDDCLKGNQGWDTLRGQLGSDFLAGLQDVDELSGGSGDDEIEGGDDTDLLWGGGGDDFMSGGDGADVLMGGDGNDTLNGNNGNDTLCGGATSGSGQDALYGIDVSSLCFGTCTYTELLYEEPGSNTPIGNTGGAGSHTCGHTDHSTGWAGTCTYGLFSTPAICTAAPP